MDVPRVWMLFQIAEQAPKFPHMSGRVLEWVRLQLIDVDKEISAEIETFKAKVQADADARKQKAIDEKPVDFEQAPPGNDPAPLPRRL